MINPALGDRNGATCTGLYSFAAISRRTAGLQALGEAIDEISFEIARRIYGRGIEVDVRLEEGTLRGWITVIGTIALTTYTVIAEYKGFTESVPLLCDKARSFGIEVCEQFIERTAAKPQQVFRVEKRLKTPGRINRLLKRVKKLDELAPKLTEQELQTQLQDIRRYLDSILEDLGNEDEKMLIESLRSFENIPAPSDLPQAPNRTFEMSKAAKKPEEDLFAEIPYTPPKTETPTQRIYHNRFLLTHDGQLKRLLLDSK